MKITKIIGLENFNVKNVTDMGNMFSNCNLLNSLDLSNWVLNENVNLADLFINCSNLSNIKVKDANIINKLSPYLPGRSSTISGNITIVGDRTNLDTTILESINWNVI